MLTDKKKELLADAGCICLPSHDQPGEISWDADDELFAVSSTQCVDGREFVVETRVAFDDVACVLKLGDSDSIEDAKRVDPEKAKTKGMNGYIRVQPDAKSITEVSFGSLVKDTTKIKDGVIAFSNTWPDPPY